MLNKLAKQQIFTAAVLLALSGGANAGSREGVAAYRHDDYATALREWQKPAAHGDPVAQNGLGELSRYGQGVPQNAANAAIWFRKAAKQGLAIAQNNLGELYLVGDGVPESAANAAIWFRKAAQQGLAIAQNNLG